jgi:eukaryotic-like serine/threonine-protein kinase
METAIAPIAHPLLSRNGVAMGTAGYMSPEQVRGEKLDARTDLFSFGLVLYEMSTGHRPFTGATAPLVHDAILNHTPILPRELNPDLPSKLEGIINKALEKDREFRFHSAAEIRTYLESLKRDLARRPHTTRSREVTVTVIAVILLFAAAAIFWFIKGQLLSSPSVPDLKLRQLTISSAENRVTSGRISPDGKYLAYTDMKGIYIKLLKTGEIRTSAQPRALKNAGVQWESGPWFRDSTRFLANAHPLTQSTDDWSSEGASVWAVSVLGEAPEKLRDNAIAYSISPDDSLISFGTNKGRLGEREIWLMGPHGEQAQKLYEANEDGSVFGLTWSPDGRRVLYIQIDKSGDTYISRDLKGGGPATAFPSPQLENIRDFSWLPDGRLLYSVDEAEAIGDTCNYWSTRIDVRTGKVIEKPRRLTNWSGFCMANISVTADSKRLAFLGWNSRMTSYVADLDTVGRQMLTPRHFPWTGGSEGAADWTADSKAILLVSNRNGHYQIFKQSLNENTAQLLVPEAYGGNPRATPDGRWVLYFAATKESQQTAARPVMRVPLAGGPSAVVFTEKAGSYGVISCARFPSALCAIAERTEDRKHAIISVLDPLHGLGRELARFDLDPTDDRWWFDISPDGTRLAAIRTPADPIYIIYVNGQATQEINVKGWRNLLAVTWTADQKGLFVVAAPQSGRALLHVDFQGNAYSVWEDAGASGETLVSASPDGRHLAMQTWNMDSNMWAIENF